MDKYDYITATIPEEKERLAKIIAYLESTNNSSDNLLDYKKRYANIDKYLNAKNRYLAVLSSIKKDKEKLEKLMVTKEEYAVDNILLEDTLLSKFHEDTSNKYKDLLYEDIKYQSEDISTILYLLFEKETDYSQLVIKRNRLKERLNKNIFPNTYNTIISQSILIEKQSSILDEIFILENNIKIEESKIEAIYDSVMTEDILKILYEFWIVDSYDVNKVDKSKIFQDNKSLISIKNYTEDNQTIANTSREEKNISFPDLNLPGVNESIFVNIDGKNYIKDEDSMS